MADLTQAQKDGIRALVGDADLATRFTTVLESSLDTTSSADELNLLDGSVAGTSVASKALALGAYKNTDVLGLPVGGLKVGTAGSETVVTSSAAELNILTGVTSSAAEINILTGVTATAAELNLNDLSVVGGLVKVKKIAISTTPTGAEQDTTWDLPAKSVVLDVWVDVTTAEVTGTTKTLDIGLLSSESGGDADGFIDGVSVAATGLKRGVFAITVGANNVAYIGAANTHTRGVLLTELLSVGDDTAADSGDGIAIKGNHLSTAVTAKSVSYTAGDVNFAEFRGAIYIVYMEIG